jgi:hypothetical protein
MSYRLIHITCNIHRPIFIIPHLILFLQILALFGPQVGTTFLIRFRRRLGPLLAHVHLFLGLTEPGGGQIDHFVCLNARSAILVEQDLRLGD